MFSHFISCARGLVAAHPAADRQKELNPETRINKLLVVGTHEHERYGGMHLGRASAIA
jgi:hypothetical protein